MKTWMKSAAVVLVFLLEASLPHARQAAQTPMPPATERAQDQRPPQGSPFSTLPGFTVTRVTPVEKVDSYIVITFDSLGRPVVSQSVSGNGTSPRLLIDNNGDGIFESEKILNDKINTCHGLWFEGRTLYANCIGPRQPEDGPAPAPAAPPAGAPAAAPGAPGAPPQGGGGRGGGGGNGDLSGLWKLTDNDGDDTYETLERITKYASGGMFVASANQAASVTASAASESWKAGDRQPRISVDRTAVAARTSAPSWVNTSANIASSRMPKPAARSRSP